MSTSTIIEWTDTRRVDGVQIRTEPMPDGLWFEREGRNWLWACEVVRTNAGPKAAPYCCYFNTVAFYRRLNGDIDHSQKIDTVDGRLSQGGWTPRMLWRRGCWWEIGGHEVRYREGVGWIMRHRLQRNGRASEEWNREQRLYSGRRHMNWWWYWPVRWTRPIRDGLRMLGVWPGKPLKGQEIAWKVIGE